MSTPDEESPLAWVPPAPGMRWVEVADGRTTHRVRLVQVPVGEPEPEPEPEHETPQQMAHVRALVADLLRRRPC